MSNSDLMLSIALGVGLAAVTGFRVFLPMLVASVAAWSGSLPLGDGFVWLGSPAAMLMLGVAQSPESAMSSRQETIALTSAVSANSVRSIIFPS